MAAGLPEVGQIPAVLDCGSVDSARDESSGFGGIEVDQSILLLKFHEHAAG